MGNSVSALLPCARGAGHSDLFFSGEPLDETLGHSFCYVRHNKISPSASGRFSPSSSGRFLPSSVPETTFFHSISGASVSANSSAPISLFSHPRADADADHYNASGKNGDNFFVGSSFFSSIPLQPIPRVVAQQQSQEFGNSGRFERGFLSGPLERGAISGPLENSDPGVHFSAPLGGYYTKRNKNRKIFSGVAIKRAFGRNFSEKKRPWVFPVLSFVGLHHSRDGVGYGGSVNSNENCSRRYCDFMEEEGGRRDFGDNLQWAHGKAGEDRVHVVVSEDNGWLFVGIYDGFNGPDAPEFLMTNLYKAVFDELEGLFWESGEDSSSKCVEENEMKDQLSQGSILGCNELHSSSKLDDKRLQEDACSSAMKDKCDRMENGDERLENGLARECGEVSESSKRLPSLDPVHGHVKRVTFKEEAAHMKRSKLLRELLAEEDDDAFSFWGSGGSSMDISGQPIANKDGHCEGLSLEAMENAVSVNSDLQQRHGKGRSLLFSKLKLSFNKQKGNARKSSRWLYDFDKEKIEVENQVGERTKHGFRKCKAGPIDHEAVLKALSKALETTEIAYLDMTDKAIDQNPELALMGSCLLVVLMKDEDVYVMNVGDSRAIVAQSQPELDDSVRELNNKKDGGSGLKGILEDASEICGSLRYGGETPPLGRKLAALQLSTDHSTSIQEEVLRIKREHLDDSQCILNDRVKGRLKVTRAFGAGFLKQAKWNNALLEMFRNEYIGTAPYISCSPSLCHHRLGANDQFLVLSSDGLYQYLSNEEVVSYVENFMEKFPDGDPAQYLIEELLFRAAKKAGMEFHELLDIPQGDRRKYHDDVTVMVISLEGRIWKSSGKY